MSSVHPIADRELGNTSYLVDLGGGRAAAVDAPRDVDRHLELAERLGLRVVAALETHLHADFISGSRELADAVGAEVIAPAGAQLTFDSRHVRECQTIRFGRATFIVLHTPGHTPEHVAYLLCIDDDPVAVFSGGALIGGGVARTDLIAPDATEELARRQFASARRIASLPDEVLLRPTHGAGSFCSTGAVPEVGTVGDERGSNALLQIDDEDDFVRTLLNGYGSFPSYFLELRPINRAGPALVRDLGAPRPMPPTDAHACMENGAVLIDARPISQWAECHPRGAVSNELRAAFASWLGWIVPFGAPVVLLVAPDRVGEATRLARRIGYDVLGWIDGGVDAWQQAGLEVVSIERIDADQARRRQREGTTLIDVRQSAEVATGRAKDAIHIELGDIIAGVMPKAKDVVVYCGHGERSATAASLLEARGVHAANLVGGLGAWEDAGLPVER